jgi:hypothetical protein
VIFAEWPDRRRLDTVARMPPPVRLTKEWQELDPASVGRLGGHTGVYQLAGPDGEPFLIGYAGGRSAFGLRGELERHLHERRHQRTLFRCEVTTAYWSRYRELLMAHVHDHGRLPSANSDDPRRLGRLSPH